ncbi:MAG: flippase-like domain-containing protein [Candidatus Omnitrophica bacterium]|nr:flippase-like domain-containing protein [Candidatus Omnitrophota bacterium]
MSLNNNVKSALSFLLRMGLSVGLLWYVFSKIDMEGTKRVLQSADITYISLAGFVFVIVNGIVLLRWFIFIKALDLSVSVKDVVRNYFYGLFGNLFLPTAIGGDIIKVIGLCKDSSQKPKVVASVLLDRLSGFASIIVIELVMLLIGYPFIAGDKVLSTAIVMIGLGSTVCAVILFNERIYSFGCRVFDRLPKVKQGFMSMHYDIALLKSGHKSIEGYKAIAVSCCSQAVFAFSWFLTAKALGQETAFFHFIAFVPMLCVASSFPSIGGLGVREAGAVYLFSKVGMESGVAVSLSLINFFFMVMVGLVGGFTYVYTLSVGRIQCYSQDAVGVGPGDA